MNVRINNQKLNILTQIDNIVQIFFELCNKLHTANGSTARDVFNISKYNDIIGRLGEEIRILRNANENNDDKNIISFIACCTAYLNYVVAKKTQLLTDLDYDVNRLENDYICNVMGKGEMILRENNYRSKYR